MRRTRLFRLVHPLSGISDWARGIERASLVSGGAFVAFGEKVKRTACIAMRRRGAQSHSAFGNHLRKSACSQLA